VRDLFAENATDDFPAGLKEIIVEIQSTD